MARVLCVGLVSYSAQSKMCWLTVVVSLHTHPSFSSSFIPLSAADGKRLDELMQRIKVDGCHLLFFVFNE